MRRFAPRKLRGGIIFPFRPSDQGCYPPSGAGGDAQDCEPGEVDCCCEELPVLGDFELSPDACPPPAVATAHEVGLLALHLGPVGLVVGLPVSGWPVAAGLPGDGPHAR